MKLDDRGQFLNLSGLVEGGLILVAFLVGWIFDVDPIEHLKFSWAALVWGALAALPMFGLFVLFLIRLDKNQRSADQRNSLTWLTNL